MEVRGHLDLLLLVVLAETGPVHGYGVIGALRERSNGAFDLPEGTIYPALHRLERDGLIASSWDGTSPRRRRVYAITPDGHQARVTKQHELRGFILDLQAVIGPLVRSVTT